MHKLVSFVRLDYLTIKPYVTGKNLLIFSLVTLFLSLMGGSGASGLGIGGMIAMLFVSYPFAVGEKSNTDALYATLAIERKQVVAGRFLFALSFNLLLMAGAVILSTIGTLTAQALGIAGVTDTPLAWIILAAFFAVIQALQLPVYFKFGYAKARFLTLIPLAGFMGLFFGIQAFSRDPQLLASVSEFLTPILSNGLLFAALTVVVIALIVFVSYQLSQRFYRMREF